MVSPFDNLKEHYPTTIILPNRAPSSSISTVIRCLGGRYPSSHSISGMVTTARMVPPVMRLAMRCMSPPSWRASM